jgi:hypothetical protein
MKRVLIFVLAFLLCVSFISATTCPFGLVNDSYPGACGRYIDSNKDGLCDLSEQPAIENSDIEKPAAEIEKPNFFKTRYNTLIIIFLSSLIYYGSYFFCRNNPARLITHKKIWNAILLLTFIPVVITSLVYLLRIDFAFDLEVSWAAFWHIEMGLIMIMVSLFHALWHLSYYKNCYFPSRNKECTN